ncbi:adhesion G protein-coupled receptor G3 isoform X2 [Oncorhynchus kisutch]|uniref:adhesion G protein-coupled receptor G3 isoform X2 n=1 Tax=Oncorhynchus kisutch TaxID=8019 RepID=UPI0012DF65B9|nr:adhesion G protein-coupled receptor G3 isoform X2 [Oncorhynchus kisutch]
MTNGSQFYSSTTPSPIPSTNTFTTPVLTTTTTLTTSATSPDQEVSLAVEINLTDYTGMKVYVSATKISFNIAEILNPELEVNLPPNLLSGLKRRHTPDMVKFIFSVLKTSPPNWTVEGQLGKILFGIEVENITISHLSTPFNMTFKHKSELQEKENTTCVYHNQSRGEWVTDGCHTLRLTNQTICSCDHFSFFALMIPDMKLSEVHARTLSVLTCVGGAISVFFCTITLLTHCLQHSRKSTDHAMLVHLQLVASLLLLNLLLLTSVGLAFVGPASMAPGLCPAVAALLHYSLLCCFTWMGLEALHLYRLLVLVYNTYMRHYLLKLSLLGWGVPALVVSIVAAVSTDFYGLNNRMCWIKDSGVQYGSVVAYLIVVLLFNSTIFAIVITTMLKLRSVTSPQGKRQSRNTTCSVLGLTCILGLTWGVGFFSMGYTNYVILYIFTILNSLQGFFLFLWLCVKRLRGAEQSSMTTGQSSSTHILSVGSEVWPSSGRTRQSVQEGAIADNIAKF